VGEDKGDDRVVGLAASGVAAFAPNLASHRGSFLEVASRCSATCRGVQRD
jgi:hypothetical protein